MKAVRVSAELDTIQRAVEGAGLLAEVGRHGGVDGEDTGAFVSAVLALAACRLRDHGRAARCTLDPEVLSAPHNTVVDVAAEDVVLRPREDAKRKRR